MIQSGNVRITKKTDKGEVEISVLREGDIFGEMALFDRLSRSATATAIGNTTVLSIDKKKLFQTINRDPTLAFKLLESMSKRIRMMDEEVARMKEIIQSKTHSIDFEDIKKRIIACIENVEKCTR